VQRHEGTGTVKRINVYPHERRVTTLNIKYSIKYTSNCFPEAIKKNAKIQLLNFRLTKWAVPQARDNTKINLKLLKFNLDWYHNALFDN